MAGFW